MDKWISIAALTMATAVAACTASQDSFKVQPVLSLDGKPVKGSAVAQYEKGKQLLRQGRFALAAQAFQTALFAGGSSVSILNALAVSYDKLGRYDLSDRYYQRALMLDPYNPQTANNLAVSLAQRGAPGLAAKVLSDAYAQQPDDKTIADNLRLAQGESATKPSEVAEASLPAPTAPPVPRIEQTSPSTQQLVTIVAHHDATSHQPAVTPRSAGDTADAAPVQSIETRPQMLGASASAAVTEPLAVAQTGATAPPSPGSITTPSPSIQLHAANGAARPDARQQPAVTPFAVGGTADAALTKMDQAHAQTVSAPAKRPAVMSESLAPPPKVGKTEPAKTTQVARVAPSQPYSTPQTGDRMAGITPRLASKGSAAQGTSTATEFTALELARSRLGSRIAESDDIQPIDAATQEATAPEFALQRLGVRVEVANGAGRRYMAARMRTYLDGRGFDVAHITNARSFDHLQTVIVYRDQYQPEALSLAKSLTTKVELVHVADLPVEVRLILGRDLLSFDRALENGG